MVHIKLILGLSSFASCIFLLLIDVHLPKCGVSLQGFIKGTIADGAPVVPISAQLKYNVDAVCEYIVKKIPVPVRSVSISGPVNNCHC